MNDDIVAVLQELKIEMIKINNSLNSIVNKINLHNTYAPMNRYGDHPANYTRCFGGMGGGV